MNRTKIPWADFTWNPVTGCTAISEGCANCYARRIADRFGHGVTVQTHGGPVPLMGHFDQIVFHPERLNEPLKARKPSRIFVCSMGDLYHEQVRAEWRMAVYRIMAQAHQHTYMILTKRQDRMLYEFGDFNDPVEHVWLGVTVENDKHLYRIEHLLQTPAAVRFVSLEPMLGPIDLDRMPTLEGYGYGMASPLNVQADLRKIIKPLDWVICGPETGPKRRPFELDWARSIRDQCAAAGIPFFYKGGLLDGVKHEEVPHD